MNRRVIYMGGNGHCAMRLAGARIALETLSEDQRFELIDVPYPGFEGRPRESDLSSFLAFVSSSIRSNLKGAKQTLVYATGIGGLLALCLRARGELPAKLILQGAVLWGLERRWMPWLMRSSLVRKSFQSLFRAGWFRRRFVRKQFERPLSDAERDAFFDGYAQCPAATDLFDWIRPTLLRSLERDLRSRPDALRNLEAWWGGKDRVVGLDELQRTEKALGVRIPVRQFPTWGHYPMIDAPAEWTRTLADALETVESV
jgi:pimeloyl-ACP methyl ester carboxylesterase